MAKRHLNNLEKRLVQAVDFFEDIQKTQTEAQDNRIIMERLSKVVDELKEEVFQVAKQRVVKGK